MGTFNVYVYFENPPGTRLTTREFDPGQPLHIAVKVRGVLGAPEPFLAVTLDIHDRFPAIYMQNSTNITGDCDFDIVLPNVVTTADVVVTVYPIGGETPIVTIPIGIGMAAPPMPQPVSLNTMLMWTAIGFGALALGFGIYKVAMSRKPQRVLIERGY